MDVRPLALVHAIVEILGGCRTAALRTVGALSALLDVAERDVVLALVLLEGAGLAEPAPEWDGCVSWRLCIHGSFSEGDEHDQI